MKPLGYTSKRNFILQQGAEDTVPQSCPLRYSAMMFQPRVIAVLLLIGIVAQSKALFLILGAVLWWNALLPRFNPFDAVYNVTLGSRSGRAKLGPAPPPRRFAQMLAGAFSLATAAALAAGNPTLAYVIEGLFAAAVAGLIFGRFCLGSFLFHLLKGNVAFALRTLPWVRRAYKAPVKQ